MSTKGILINLIAQFERIFKHNRQTGIRTKRRYREAMIRFLTFLAEDFHLEKISNIAPKHIYAYVAHLIEKGCEIGYIKTELPAIRFWFDQIPNTKYELPSNDDLQLGRRQYGGVDHTWSSCEFNRALALVSTLGLEMYVAILCLARYCGLQRKVPINLSIEIELRKMLDITPRGRKLFVVPGDKTHLVMLCLESFLYEHKTEIQDPVSTRPMSFHRLRHSYAVEQYKKFVDQGMPPKKRGWRLRSCWGTVVTR